MADLASLSKITIGCLLDGAPFEGAGIRVFVGVTRKNAFSSLLMPANAAGVISVSGIDLLDDATREMQTALMDYPSPHTDLNGVISVEPVTLEQADRAMYACGLWGPDVYRPGYVERLVTLRQLLADVSPAELSVKVLAVKPDDEFTVTAHPRRVRSDRIS